MPWMKPNHDCPQPGIISPVTYFQSNFLGYFDKENKCLSYEESSKSFVKDNVIICCIISWVIIFLSLFKGIKVL